MDSEKFEAACKLVSEGGRLIKGIGTRGEGSVHAVLKNYFRTDQDDQERQIGAYVADIVDDKGITEIQTGHFTALKDKLEAFLPLAHVRVVYPVYCKKRIISLDSEGQTVSSRISPLKGSAYDIFREMFPIARFLTDKNLSILIVLMECDEYRAPAALLNRPERRHGRLSVCDRMPTKLINEIEISSVTDWIKLIPCLYAADYTTTDLARDAHISRKHASTALSLLHRAGIIERTGKKGRSLAYRFKNA